jgi:hypothetical protein
MPTFPTRRDYNNCKNACEHCVSKKIRCIRELDTPCSNCVEKNISCVSVPKKKRGPKTKSIKLSIGFIIDEVDCITYPIQPKTGLSGQSSG